MPVLNGIRDVNSSKTFFFWMKYANTVIVSHQQTFVANFFFKKRKTLPKYAAKIFLKF